MSGGLSEQAMGAWPIVRTKKVAKALEAAEQRAVRAEAALRDMLDCLDRHELWCGHNADAPGDGIVNRAPERARAVLASVARLGSEAGE